MGARSSRPRHSPNATDQAAVDRIGGGRRQRLTGEHIARVVAVSPATVSRVLTRAGLSRLKDLEPAEPVRRYEHVVPGGMIHIDINRIWWRGDRRPGVLAILYGHASKACGRYRSGHDATRKTEGADVPASTYGWQLASPHQVADRLMLPPEPRPRSARPRGAGEPGLRHPGGLSSLSRPHAWNQRRCHHHAVMPQFENLAIKTVTRGTGLVAKVKFGSAL